MPLETIIEANRSPAFETEKWRKRCEIAGKMYSILNFCVSSGFPSLKAINCQLQMEVVLCCFLYRYLQIFSFNCASTHWLVRLITFQAQAQFAQTTTPMPAITEGAYQPQFATAGMPHGSECPPSAFHVSLCPLVVFLVSYAAGVSAALRRLEKSRAAVWGHIKDLLSQRIWGGVTEYFWK